MPAYVIAETDVTDPERYEQYKAALECSRFYGLRIRLPID